MTSIGTGRLVRNCIVPSGTRPDSLVVSLSQHLLSSSAVDLVLEAPADFFTIDEDTADDFISLHFIARTFGDKFYYTNLPCTKEVVGERQVARRIIVTVSFAEALESEMTVALMIGGARRASILIDPVALSERSLRFSAAPCSALRDVSNGAPPTFSAIALAPRAAEVPQTSFLYLSGTQKSGTTWLENIFNSDPRVLVLHEGNTLSFLETSGLSEQNAKSASSMSYVPWYPTRVDAAELSAMLQAGISRFVLEHYGSLWGAGVVGDRTPGLTSRLHRTICKWPSLRIVHIVRHPLDVVVSWLFHDLNFLIKGDPNAMLAAETGSRLSKILSSGGHLIGVELVENDQIENILHQWASDQEAALRLKRDFPDQVHLLTYEELSTAYNGSVERLFSFAGLSLRDDELASVLSGGDFRRYSGGREQGQKDSSSFYRSGTVGDNKNYFTEEARTRMYSRVAEIARVFGYSL